MKNTQLAMIMLLVFGLQLECQAREANNLSDSKNAARDAAGKKAFEEQIEGKAPAIPPYPSGVNRQDLLSLLFGAQQKPIAKDDLQGPFAIAYPGRPGLFVAAAGIRDYGNQDNPINLSLAVFKIDAPHKLTAVAKPKAPLKLGCTWEFVQDAPGEGVLYDTDLEGIDGATFNLGNNQFAFALKMNHSEGYAGGFASYQSFHLMTIDDSNVVELLTAPVYAMQNFSGDWHKDGTRAHEVNENKLVVVVMPTEHDGYKDVVIRQVRGGHHVFKMQWSSKQKKYVGAGTTQPQPFK